MIASAYHHFLAANYEAAARLYEADIEVDPDNTHNYWYLGLTYLLLEQEETAQVTWLTGLSQIEATEGEHIASLFQALQQEAIRLERLESYRLAWMIRSHASEVCPEELNNLLQLVWLSLTYLQNFNPNQLIEFGLVDLLSTTTLAASDLKLLEQIGTRLKQEAGDHPIVAEFLQSCVPQVLTPPTAGEVTSVAVEDPVEELEFQRHSWPGTLFNLRNMGFMPATVVDVGAGVGTFGLYHIFPESQHLLIEPRPQDAPYLEKLCNLFPQAQYITAGVSRDIGSLEMEVPEADGTKTIVPVPLIPLDQLCAERQLSGPYLLKIDVDGAEIDVLKGAEKVLEETEYLIIETTLFNQFYDVLDFMRERGFVVYDIISPLYRLADGALWQVDTAFVKANGRFRQNLSFYANPGQQQRLAADLRQHDQFMINYLDERFVMEMERIRRAMEAGKIVIVCS